MKAARLLILGIALAITLPTTRLSTPRAARGVAFKKIVLDSKYRAEGVAVADVNRDGKLDIIAGNFWYEAPDWTPHEIAPALNLDPAKDKSNCYLCFSADVNHDGWPDEIIISRPGTTASWRENSGKKGGFWPEHLLAHSACNESPHFVDLFGDGVTRLVFAHDDSYMSWYEPGPDPRKEWIAHDISEARAPGTGHFDHGLGIGDMNKHGRLDILCKDGWWEAPEDRSQTPWKFVPANLGPECGQMHVLDVNGDGLPDVISSSAHRIGVWWWERTSKVSPRFIQHVIDESFSQSHAMVMADIDGDGLPDIVTGKRFWAHGPAGDINPNDPAVLYWFELKRSKGKVVWIKHLIDSDSGVGVQFMVTDVNRDGLPDIVTANRKGVFLFLQSRTGQ